MLVKYTGSEGKPWPRPASAAGPLAREALGDEAGRLCGHGGQGSRQQLRATSRAPGISNEQLPRVSSCREHWAGFPPAPWPPSATTVTEPSAQPYQGPLGHRGTPAPARFWMGPFGNSPNDRPSVEERITKCGTATAWTMTQPQKEIKL